MIQSKLSAWIERDFISHSLHSVVARLVIGDFCLPVARRRIDLSNEYIFAKVLTSAEVIFFSQKTPPLLLAK